MPHPNPPNLLITSPVNCAFFSRGRVSPSAAANEITLLLTPAQAYLICSRLVFGLYRHLPGFHSLYFTSAAAFAAALTKLLQKHAVTRLGFEDRHLTVNRYRTLRTICKTTRTRLVPAQGAIDRRRLIKQPRELKRISAACALTNKVLAFLAPRVKPGTTEKELACQAERYFLDHGARTLAFPIIVASGPNSAIPHHVSSTRKIARRDTVLIDLGCQIDGYCSDSTRTFFTGTPDQLQLQVASAVTAAHTAALQTINSRPQDTPAAAVDLAARQTLKAAGFAKYFIHNTGHGIGLQIHEAPTLSPTSTDRLQAQMTYTVEPGVYLPGRFGYRHEDTLLQTAKQAVILT